MTGSATAPASRAGYRASMVLRGLGHFRDQWPKPAAAAASAATRALYPLSSPALLKSHSLGARLPSTLRPARWGTDGKMSPLGTDQKSPAITAETTAKLRPSCCSSSGKFLLCNSQELTQWADEVFRCNSVALNSVALVPSDEPRHVRAAHTASPALAPWTAPLAVIWPGERRVPTVDTSKLDEENVQAVHDANPGWKTADTT